MDPVTCRALGAMYKQLRRAFKIAGALGRWWQATSGILQGCPLSVILVNVPTTIWKWEVDSVRRQVCAPTAALPPTLDEEAAADVEVGAPLPLNDAGPGCAVVGLSGYADDTQAVALAAASLQGTVPTRQDWLQVTGQDVRGNKSCPWVQGEQGAPAPFSGVSRSRWQTPSANFSSTSPLGVPRLRGRWCPAASKQAGACSAASPTFPPMTARSGPSAC